MVCLEVTACVIAAGNTSQITLSPDVRMDRFLSNARFLPALLIAAVVCFSGEQTAQGQTPAGQAAPKVYVAFRMEKWTSRHLSASDATEHEQLLKKLGCEVKTAQHDGHMDVTARTIFWKVLEVDSHDKAHGWVTWFQKSGFETIHGHKVGTHQHVADDGKVLEIVQYRLADWKSQHIHKTEEMTQLLALTRGLGCEVQSNSHNGHTDVKMRCPEWMEIELNNHEAAHSWQKFLNDLGFETKHEH